MDGGAGRVWASPVVVGVIRKWAGIGYHSAVAGLARPYGQPRFN